MASRTQLVLIAGLGSAAILGGAFAFQYLGGLAPCQLCLWQRWPHAAAIGVMILALFLPGRALPFLGMLAALTTAGIGMFHVGVEYQWWEGLASCSGNSIAGLSVNDLLNPDVAIAAPIRCDAVAWSLFGISMAGWNVILSLGLAGVWAIAAGKRAA
jgi:disulfide bond formation protein DsbB